MTKDIKILIVPDVHGREFWRQPVTEVLNDPGLKNTRIVFLGDYVDPYPKEKIPPEQVTDILKEIIELRRNNDNITLLLGNHDAGYAVDSEICECRRDWRRYGTIAEIFLKDIDLFDIAYEQTINKKRFLLTHAGVHFKTWIKYNTYIFPKGFRVTAKNLNEMFRSEDRGIRHGFEIALRDISWRRGGYEAYGSLLWADIQEFLNGSDYKDRKLIQVVGHTMLKGVGVNLDDKFYCLDCKRVFYIDSKGDVRYYDNDEVLTAHKS